MRVEEMLSVEEALERVLGYVQVLGPEEKPVLEALGQVLAQDVVASFDIPPLANSAMDGYAVQAASLTGASRATPRRLRVIGQVAAGYLSQQQVREETAVRIMTGAPLPPGADAVVPFEATDEVERLAAGLPLDEIRVYEAVPKGSSVRPAGEDVRRGELVLREGTVLRPGEIGVLASLGMARVRVIRRPVVGVLATGDELLEPGQASQRGRIYDSNSYSVAASVLRYGGIPRLLGIARDTMESVHARVAEGLSTDLLLTSAGVSKGDYDMVKDVLAQAGEIAFWSVRMRPAKPLAFGYLRAPDGRRVPHLGLPGNPVSALVAFEEFARPAILKIMGKRELAKPTVQAVLEESIRNTDGRRIYARVIVTRRNGQYYARLTGHQGSGILTSMARANGLAICPEEVPRLEAGELAQVQMLDWPEDAGL